MQNLRYFFSVFFLIISLIIIVLIALIDHTVFIRVANEIKNYLWPAGIAIFVFVALLVAGIVSHASDYEGSLMSNGYILLAMLEFFVFAAGLAYYRYYIQQPGHIVFKVQPETTKDHINLALKYQGSGSVSFDTVKAPGRLENRPAGTYSFEILDEDIVYYRDEFVLESAETETLVIPVVLNVRILTVQTDPPGADIWIDSLQASQTPDTFKILTGDTVTLELKKPGYVVYKDTISLHENVDLGVIPLQKEYTLWISSLYDYMNYKIYDMEGRVVFSASRSRKCQLPQGQYRISYEIGEGAHESKSFSLNYNATVTIP